MSDEDFDFTNRFYHARLSFGMEIIDHIILGDNTYYGFDENEYMDLIHEHLKYKSYNDIKPRIEQERKEYGNIKKYESLKKGIEKRNIEIVKKMLKVNADIYFIAQVAKMSFKDRDK